MELFRLFFFQTVDAILFFIQAVSFALFTTFFSDLAKYKLNRDQKPENQIQKTSDPKHHEVSITQGVVFSDRAEAELIRDGKIVEEPTPKKLIPGVGPLISNDEGVLSFQNEGYAIRVSKYFAGMMIKKFLESQILNLEAGYVDGKSYREKYPNWTINLHYYGLRLKKGFTEYEE